MTRLELFYDLVFVFAFLNVSSLATENLTRSSLLEALLMLALLWWCWSGFAVLGNILRADQGVMPVVGFAVMAAVFVLALTTDTAFHDEPLGLDDPFVFACAYTVIWSILIAALWATVGPSREERLRLLTLTAPTAVGVGIIMAGGTLPDFLFPPDIAHNFRVVLWTAALVVEYSVGILVGRTGFRLPSLGHWAERHALIVLIALGESVIGLGVGATNRASRAITGQVIVAAVLGIAVIAALWWLYFDVLASYVEQVLHGVRGSARIPVARDIYTFLHLPLVAGVILFSLGLERLLGAVSAHTSTGGLNVLSLFGGVIVYVLASVAIEARASGRVDPVIVATAVLLLILVPVANHVPALAGLALLTVVVVALVVAQLLTKREVRRRVRQLIQQEEAELEAAVSRWRRRFL